MPGGVLRPQRAAVRAAGIAANSIAPVGWALGSVIEGLASIIVIWRFPGSRTVSETSERRAQQAVAISFFLLAPYIGAESIRDLGGGHEITPNIRPGHRRQPDGNAAGCTACCVGGSRP